MNPTRTTIFTAAFFALSAALAITFIDVDSSHACGTYGLDDETLVEWAVADHLSARETRDARRDTRAETFVASAPRAEKPTWKFGKIEVLKGRIALAPVVWTHGQRTTTEYFTLIKKNGRWQLVGAPDLIS